MEGSASTLVQLQVSSQRERHEFHGLLTSDALHCAWYNEYFVRRFVCAVGEWGLSHLNATARVVGCAHMRPCEIPGLDGVAPGGRGEEEAPACL